MSVVISNYHIQSRASAQLCVFFGSSGLHNGCSISPTCRGTCQKSDTKHYDWADTQWCSVRCLIEDSESEKELSFKGQELHLNTTQCGFSKRSVTLTNLTRRMSDDDERLFFFNLRFFHSLSLIFLLPHWMNSSFGRSVGRGLNLRANANFEEYFKGRPQKCRFSEIRMIWVSKQRNAMCHWCGIVRALNVKVRSVKQG